MKIIAKLNRTTGFRMVKPVMIIWLAILALITTTCSNLKKEPYTIIRVKTNDGARNFSKSLFGCIFPLDSIHGTAMMVEKGDLLGVGKDGIPVYYTNTAETELTVSPRGPFCYVNGKIYSIQITKDFDLLPWFKQMKSSDISGLKSLLISRNIPENYYPYLKEIAKTKPEIGLWFDKEPENKELLNIFKPVFLAGMNISQKDYDQYPNLKEVELLLLPENDSLISSPLPYLPKLKQIIILDVNTWSKHKNLFEQNKQLERLSISGEPEDFSFLLPLKTLKELSIVSLKNEKEKKSMAFLKEFRHLEVLSLVGGKYSDFSVLNELSHLRWLSLMTNTSQQDFESIVQHHKDLEMLEFLTDSTKSLKPLLQFEKLRGLVILNANKIDPTLLSMKKLKYLSVSKEAMKKDSTRVAELREALPNCTVVPNDGFCMGSGWLLLLIPLVLLFRILIRKRSFLL